MTLRALTLRLVLLRLLTLRDRGTSAKSLCSVEAALRRLLDAPSLRALTALAHTNANVGADILHTANAVAVRFVGSLRGCSTCSLADRRAG